MARILVVDDDVRTAQFVALNLNAAGHECTVASNGKEALARAQASPVDLVVLDVMMPGGVSGFQVCRQLRGNPDLYALPVLILSAMSGEEEIRHGLSQGADDYVGKPFEMQNLIQRVDMLLRGNADIKALDEMTALPGAAAIKRELQRRISCQEQFVAVSVELMRLREFAYQCGKQARVEAIRQLARILKEVTREIPDNACVVGHMGGGYFIGLFQLDIAESSCTAIVKKWRDNVASLYARSGQEKAYREALAVAPIEHNASLMDALVCMTTHHQRDRISSQALFETLTQLRNKALAASVSGIHVNRRT